MGLLDLFRPKWKHSRLDVRRPAVDALGEHQRDALTWVARHDPEPELRRAVLDRIDDAPLLAERAATDPDPAVAAFARQRLQVVTGGPAAQPAARKAPAPPAAPARPAAVKPAKPAKPAKAPKPAKPAKPAKAPKPARLPAEPKDASSAEVMSVAEAERRYGALFAKPAPAPQARAAAPTLVSEAPVQAELAPLPVSAPVESPPVESPPEAPRRREPRVGPRDRDRDQAREQERERERAYIEWAVLPRFRELIDRADAALAIADADGRLLLRLKRELMDEWAALGPPPRDQASELRAAFGERLDRLSARGRAGLEAMDVERNENLEKKLAILLRLEALASASDLRAATAEMTEIQAAWRAVGPVPKADLESSNARYRAALDAFFRRKKASLTERAAAESERLEALRRVVEQAEALTRAADPAAAAERAKALQATWKSIGRAGSREDHDALWTRLRAACDEVFARRNTAETAALEANATKKEALIARALALAEEGEVADPDLAVRALMNDWRKVGHVPRARADQLWGEFRAALDRDRKSVV